MSTPSNESIPAPWVLLDELTVTQTVDLLERLTTWLRGCDPAAAARCTRALSLGQTNDPESIAGWTDAFAAQLRHRVEHSRL